MLVTQGSVSGCDMDGLGSLAPMEASGEVFALLAVAQAAAGLSPQMARGVALGADLMYRLIARTLEGRRLDDGLSGGDGD